jgi:tRNA (cmo5U34)-methyltransferase
MKFDVCIDLETQLQWLRDVGFRSVDCLAKDFRFATYAGWVS